MTAQPGENTIELTLAGENAPVVLTATAKVALALCREPGGLEVVGGTFAPGTPSTVQTRLLSLDIPTMAKIIRLGLDVGPNALPKLEDQIFETGLYLVMVPLMDFLTLIRNGGRKASLAEQQDGGDATGTENPQNL